jgi:hypothetical protein
LHFHPGVIGATAGGHGSNAAGLSEMLRYGSPDQ